MPQVYYDLHIHTALSPCAANDMIPSDIVGMAILNNLDVIAITDHNSFANAEAVCKAAQNTHRIPGRERDLIVLPGSEITTAEEVHVLCLFDDISVANAFEAEISPYYSKDENRPDIFGEQLICDSDDTILDRMGRMLISPTSVTFHELFNLTRKHGGAFVPAHVDRGSFSVESNLGFLPPELDIAAIEFTSKTIFGEYDSHNFKRYPGEKYIFSSDAHQLYAINERVHYLTLPEVSAKAVIDYLRF